MTRLRDPMMESAGCCGMFLIVFSHRWTSTRSRPLGQNGDAIRSRTLHRTKASREFPMHHLAALDKVRCLT